MKHLPILREHTDDDGPLALFAVAREEEAPLVAPPVRRDLANPLVRQALEAVLRALRGRDIPIHAVPDPATGEMLDEVLGVGDAWVDVLGRHTYRARETTLPGVWRVKTYDADEKAIGDHLEVADVPRVVRAAAHGATSYEIAIPDDAPGLMNARPLLAELRHRAAHHPSNAPNHVISLSLLPLTAGDVDAMRSALGAGPVIGGSRGYGRCHVALTERARIWNVQYLNAMGVVVLDTLEIGDVPVALRALPEDLEDSAARLEEILARGEP